MNINATANHFRLSYVALALIVLGAVLIRLQMLSIPFERDEGSYLYMGQLILDGKTPYLDFYEMKLPGLFYAYALLAKVFGVSVEGAHAGTMMINALTIVLIFLLGRRLLDNLSALVASASYAVLSLAPSVSGFAAQSEHIVVFLAVAGLLLLLASLEKERWIGVFLGGALICASFLVKSNGVFFILLGGLTAVTWNLVRKPISWRNCFRDGLIYSAGVFATFGAVCAVMWQQGALGEMWFWVFEFPKEYVGLVKPEEGIKLFKGSLQAVTRNYRAFWFLALLGLLALPFVRRPAFTRIFLILFSVLSAATIVPGLRFYGHYWIQLLPAVSMLIGVAAFAGVNLLARPLKQSGATLAVSGALVALLLITAYSERHYYFRPDFDRILRQTYGINPFPEAKVVGDRIRNRAEPGDQITVLGAEPEMYIYTGLRSPSRHFYFQFLLRKTRRAHEWQEEFIREVESAEPRFIVLFKHPISIRVFPGADKTVLDWLPNYINADYRLVGVSVTTSATDTFHYWDDTLALYKGGEGFHIQVFERKTPPADVES